MTPKLQPGERVAVLVNYSRRDDYDADASYVVTGGYEVEVCVHDTDILCRESELRELVRLSELACKFIARQPYEPEWMEGFRSALAPFLKEKDR